MRTLQWITARLGTEIQAPGGLGGQCVDAANDYIARVRGLAPVRLNAADWTKAALPGMVWEPNGALNHPPLGAIVVWGGSVPNLGIGPYGHVAIAIAGDADDLLTADQNWGGVHRLRFVEHSYLGVTGWWMPALATPLRSRLSAAGVA